MKNSLLFRMVVLMAAMMCALGASAKEAYACYTSENKTLTFYYDNERSTRSDYTWLLQDEPGHLPLWSLLLLGATKAEFDRSFANYRPTTTHGWFYYMQNLQSITGMRYLNTSEVTDMAWMFSNCTELTSLDLNGLNTSKVTDMSRMFEGCTGLTSLNLNGFNTSKVTDMGNMFDGCTSLQTIIVGERWNTAAVTYSKDMFHNTTNLVGGKGTAYDASHVGGDYAHIDGGADNPGYFSEKPVFIRGDVNGDGSVTIADVSTLIDYLLSGETAPAAADCNQDNKVSISDVTTLIDYLLSGAW